MVWPCDTPLSSLSLVLAATVWVWAGISAIVNVWESVFEPPVSRTVSKSVSLESTPTITLPVPNADHVPKPNSV